MSRFVIFISLFFTILLGVCLRLKYAGAAYLFGDLDLRRAHYHLGYYGVLFPIAWCYAKSIGLWVPQKKNLLIYLFFVVLSAIGFVLYSYGLLAKLASTGVLIFWLLFAWKNKSFISFFQKTWTGGFAPVIFISAVMIGIIAATADSSPDFSQKLARTFLILLLYGVFIPLAFARLKAASCHSGLWLLGTFAMAIELSQLYSHWLLSFINFTYGLYFSYTSYKMNQPILLRTLWLTSGVALVALVVGILPTAQPVAIAGIHFLFLGPLLMTYILNFCEILLPVWIIFLYMIFLLLMTLAIGLIHWLPHYILLMHKISFLMGVGIALVMLLGVLVRSNVCPKAK